MERAYNTYYEKLLRCRDAVEARAGGFRPQVALTLGTGLGPLAESMDVRAEVPYGEAGLPASTAPGHAGRFLFGYIAGVPVVCMQGRLHYYEGLDVHDVVLPTRIMGLLGARTLFLTNAAGALKPDMEVPSLMVIRDHILYGYPNPLVGPNLDALGPRFPDMTEVYDAGICALLLEKGRGMGIPMSEGIYAQLTGPSFETPAEIRLLGMLGGGAVGMSTGCEAIAARHMGMRVCGVSCVTNMGTGLSGGPISVKAIDEAGLYMGKCFSALIAEVMPALASFSSEQRGEDPHP